MRTFWDVVEGRLGRRPWADLARMCKVTDACLQSARARTPGRVWEERIAIAFGVRRSELIAEMEETDVPA